MADDDHDFCDLRAVFVSGTLKRSREVSNTEGLTTNSAANVAAHGVRTETRARWTTTSHRAFSR